MSCKTCPFNSSGEGLVRRNRTAPKLWFRIEQLLRKGNVLYCGEENADDEQEVCEGAEEWKRDRGIQSTQEQFENADVDALTEMRRMAIE